MVGYGVLTCRSGADPVHDMSHEGGVHPSYRGHGLGAELLDWAEQIAVPLHNDRMNAWDLPWPPPGPRTASG